MQPSGADPGAPQPAQGARTPFRPAPPRPHLAWTAVSRAAARGHASGAHPPGRGPAPWPPSRAPAAAVRASEEGRGVLGAEAPAGLGPGAPRAAREEESAAGKSPAPACRSARAGSAPAAPAPPRTLSGGREGFITATRSARGGLARGEGRGGGGTPGGYVTGRPAVFRASSLQDCPTLPGVRRDP